jgi:hypothetical protein
MRVAAFVLIAGLAVGCGSHADSGALGGRPAVIATPVFMAACPNGARPQSELDYAGLPPLVPTGPILLCLRNATSGGSAYDSGYDDVIQLLDGRDLHVYERRGAKPAKAGAVEALRSGARAIGSETWTWSVLVNGATMLDAVTRGVYVELDLRGDETQVDTLVELAKLLRPVESIPRPAAAEICAALRLSATTNTVLASFASSAKSVAIWQETPETPGGPHVIGSAWRAHPPDEPVAVCYLEGSFGAPGGPPGAGAPGPSTYVPWQNDRLVALVGVDRHPISWRIGDHANLTITDPGP